MDLQTLLPAFGQPLESVAIEAVLSGLPEYRIQKPAGVDLLFRDPEARAGRRQKRILDTVFLYAEGVEHHRAFAAPLPLGFCWEDDRTSLLSKHTPVRTWKIGTGEVPVSHADPDNDIFLDADLEVLVIYRHQEIRSLQLSRSAPSA